MKKKYLLDTCVLLWALERNTKKIPTIIPIIEDSENYIAVSVITYWEIVIKKALGKLSVPDNLISTIEKTGFTWINLEIRHIQQLEKLPLIHHDPFDRLLIAQSQADELTLLTMDKKILEYT